MALEETISTVINQYGGLLFSGAVVVIVTVFVMNSLKDFAMNLVRYFSVKMSNLGFNTMIYWDHELYKVEEIKFTQIVIKDENKIIFIPIELWMKSAKEYPIPGLNQFKEFMWDGGERRHPEHNRREPNPPK